MPQISMDITTAHHYAGISEKLGNSLKIGAVSEEGIVQAVSNGVRFFGFQFHPENFYVNSFASPNSRFASCQEN